MTIGWFRDLIICVFGGMATIALLVITILAISVYRKTKSVMKSVEGTSANIQEITTEIRNRVITPAGHVGSVFQGIYKGIDVISKLFHKK